MRTPEINILNARRDGDDVPSTWEDDGGAPAGGRLKPDLISMRIEGLRRTNVI